VDIFPIDGAGNTAWTAKLRAMVFTFLHGLKITSNWTTYHRSKLRKWYYEPFRYVCYLIGKLLGRTLIDRMVYAPRKRFRLDGGIELGDRAEITVFDLHADKVIDPAEFLSKGKATPFEGWRVHAECKLTISDRTIAYNNMD
jgi:hypothetical protein